MSLGEAKRVLRDVRPPASAALRDCVARLLHIDVLAQRWLRLREALQVWRNAYPHLDPANELPETTEYVRRLRALFRERLTGSEEDNGSHIVTLLSTVSAQDWNRRAWALPLEELRGEVASLKTLLELYLRPRRNRRDTLVWLAGDHVHQSGRILEARSSWNLFHRRRLWRETTTPPRP